MPWLPWAWVLMTSAGRALQRQRAGTVSAEIGLVIHIGAPISLSSGPGWRDRRASTWRRLRVSFPGAEGNDAPDDQRPEATPQRTLFRPHLEVTPHCLEMKGRLFGRGSQNGD